MKNIALMNTAIFSFNQGDYIIMESVKRELNQILRDSFVVEIPTHSPMFHVKEFGIRKNNSFMEKLNSFDYKIVCGTNLLAHNMNYKKTTWNINLKDTKYFGNMILLGVGTDPSDEPVNSYTRKLYQQALSKDFIHSTRDERTKKMLIDMGFKAINTGCATIWGLNQEHCKKIPTKKSESVVFTLTDYAADPDKDREMIQILEKNYKSVYFWIQGVGDLEYYMSLNIVSDVQFISPNIDAYNEFLKHTDCDFVGTRLHAGIKAMQLFKRSIIIGVDNRARDMVQDYNLHVIEREEISEQLEKKINSSFETNICIQKENIDTFLSQFKTR